MDLNHEMFLNIPIEMVVVHKIEHCQRLYHAGYTRKQVCAFYQALKSTDYGRTHYFLLAKYLDAVRDVYGSKSNKDKVNKDMHIRKLERKIDNIYRMIHDMNARLKLLEA